ncbi:cation:proton antiporter [Loigolactobacillus binensis]|uniref:Cation:proton antiporter n=1 Tax=Loigolactobacillus binensis TaxID=2559922 RepID=A0ABW3EI47_9LACO|nr:sodium:proton antiporter [Loigolactobacillus binensis]
MNILEAVIMLVSVVLVSNVISHYLTFLPVSLIQIMAGLLLALLFKVTIPLRTDWFMLLFIAPLLFNDGRHFPKRELWALRGPIVMNAIFLVFVTMFVGGWFIHFLVPDLPLAASIALAAIISPTDPVAVQSISQQAKLPSNVLHLVSGESLINDASGLIGFKYGIAAAVTGIFSWQQAAGDFFYISIVGALMGMVLMAAIQAVRTFMLQQGINDVVLHTVLQIVTPFIIYLVVEELLHASGVIAVVSAGIVYNFSQPALMDYLPELKIVTERTWDIAIYLLNGLVFLILGIELPLAMTQTIRNPSDNTWMAIGDIILVWLVIFLIRVLWTLVNVTFKWIKDRQQQRPSLGVALLSGLTGVRGAITMAGVLSVPYTLASGAAFPERSLMLFIAAGVIILSLLMAVIFIPLLTRSHIAIATRGTEPAADSSMDTTAVTTGDSKISESEARIYTLRLAINRLESERRPENQRVVYDLITEYQEMVRRLQAAYQPEERLAPFLNEELTLRRVALQGEADVLAQLWQAGTIQERSYQQFQKQLRNRMRIVENLPHKLQRPNFFTRVHRIGTWFSHLRYKIIRVRFNGPYYSERLMIEKETAKGGIKALSAYLKKPEAKAAHYNRQIIYQIIVSYRNRIEQVKHLHREQNGQHSRRADYDRAMRGLRFKALAAERSGIQSMLEQGYISWALAAKLRQYVNYSENALLLGEDVD